MKHIYSKVLIAIVFLFGIGKTNAQTISNVNPSIGMEGTTINVAISGQNSNFLQGTTTVWFNQGSSTIYASSVNVSSAVELVAQVGLPYGTTLGLYQTNVQDPVDNVISLANSFTVIANPSTPVITNVNPSTTMEGTALTVSISGQNSNFQQGTTTVWFNQGSSTIYASNVNVNSLTSLDAFFTIPFGTPLGLYDTNVQDPIDNTITSLNSFTITANPIAPELVSVTPNNGDLNTTIQVTISGQNTNFLQGTGTVYFVQGGFILYTSNITYNTNTALTALVNIPDYATPGYYDVYVVNPLDGTMLLANGFYVNPPPCGSIIVDITQQPCFGSTAFINIVGGFAPYTMIIDGQTIPIANNYLDFLPPGIGTFTITSLVDNFGCQATAIDSIINNEEFSASFTATSACQGSSVTFTNNIISSSPVTSIYYYYGDGFAGLSSSHSYNYAGNYTATMEVTNSAGCSLSVFANNSIQILPLPQDSIVSLTNANCGLSNGAFEITGVGNGPFTYDVNGVGGYSSGSALNTGLIAGTYNINISDANGCSSSNMLSIANVSNLTNITGTIQTSTGDDASNTAVTLYNLADTVGAMTTSYITTTDASGNYSFSNLTEGNYILSAQPDTSLFPNTLLTYSNGSAVWFDSDTILITCTSQQVIDITLIDAVQQIGTAEIGGFVADYTINMLANTGVVLIDNTNSQTVARTSTDATGNYNFTNVNAGYYAVLVDIPGLQHNTTYAFNIDANDVFWNKSYFVNFDFRTIDTVFFFVGVNEITSFESFVYPNPFTEQTTISYTLANNSNVNIEVYNYLGEKVETLVNEKKPVGNHKAIFNAINKSKGIYFVKITAGNSQKTLKVINAE